MLLSSSRRRATVLVAAAVSVAGLATVPIASSASARPAVAPTASAPGAPGTLSRFDLARKDCVGTARNDTSKVWFTVADGVLSDVYEPTIDNTNVQSLQYIVSDGKTFSDLQTRDTTYQVRSDSTGMQCTVISTSAAHKYSLVTTYIADPARDTVLIHTRIDQPAKAPKLSIYARLDGHVNGNGGGGADNGGADTGSIAASGAPVIGDTGTVSQAANRDYAVPTFMALDSPTRSAASVGYEGTLSDGLTELDATHKLQLLYGRAPNGHVVATENVTPSGTADAVNLALGFGRTAQAAAGTAADSLKTRFITTSHSYLAGWAHYDAGLRKPLASLHPKAYYLSANVLRASQDKTFPGAVVASLASPWGQAVSAGALVGGKPVYFGSYREVFARDLYEAVTGYLADGDLSSARAATRFLLLRQQQASGELPRNSLLNGKVAPDTGGDQLDETAYPILMTYLTGLGGSDSLYEKHIVPAADFLVSHGPSFGVERWEEQSGYSPSTIAAEIAGLTAAAVIAGEHGDAAHERLYHAVADQFQRTVKAHTVTTDGPYSSKPYFIRLAKTDNPNDDSSYSLGNGSVSVDQKAVVDGGFQELVRLGELAPTDPDVVNSLAVLDKQIAVKTPTGTGYYRYGNDAAKGSADGYGDCYQPSQTSCTVPGEPWPTTDVGTGHLWPVLSGERGESALAAGQTSLADSQLAFMRRSASGEGLVPEQVWEDPAVAASAYGTDPATASIGFTDGEAAGSASPLTWAQAQELRLTTDLTSGKITDRPGITTTRYVTHAAPTSLPVTITAPTAGQTVDGTTTVSGTTTPNAKVEVSSIGTDADTASVTPGKASASGAFSVSVPAAFGTNIITVTATVHGGTGYAQLTVNGDLVGGTSVLDVTDPAGDDNGPGTYQYPTAADFTAGSFDITRFQVLTKDGTVYLRTTLANLTPTFGATLGAQLLDLYVRNPSATTFSTAAPFASRNYSIAADSAWSERLEVQGFASPTWVDASGNQVGTAQVVTSTSAKTVTIALPETQFGTPASGWKFAETLAGQDGFSSDQARAFTATPQGYTFGVCAAGGSSPICAVDPTTVPKVLDAITPDGVDQASELNPTLGAVVVHGVPVP
jgi:glucoamylase